VATPSLEGIARDWYRSLPITSINSLADFHVAFHVFCKGIFSDDFLFLNVVMSSIYCIKIPTFMKTLLQQKILFIMIKRSMIHTMITLVMLLTLYQIHLF
jgi:hypothetical protein